MNTNILFANSTDTCTKCHEVVPEVVDPVIGLPIIPIFVCVTVVLIVIAIVALVTRERYIVN